MECRCILDGLNQTEDGPEEVFVLRASDPAAPKAAQAWIDAARIHGVEGASIQQAMDFIKKASIYKGHYGVFPKSKPDLICFDKKDAPLPTAPPKPMALNPVQLKAAQEIGAGDGAPEQPTQLKNPNNPKGAGRKPGVPNKRRQLLRRANGKGSNAEAKG